MTKPKITPKTFNETAWNLGLPFRWNDKNNNGVVENNEVDGRISLAQLKIILEGASGKHLEVVRTPEYIAGLQKKVDALRGRHNEALGKLSASLYKDALRRALRDRDMAYRSWAKHEIDFTSLSEADQKVAWIFIYEIFPAVEQIHAIQNDPNNLRYFSEIAATGNFLDLAHAWYSGGPWCQEVREDRCSSHPQFPKRIPNAGLWPQTFTQNDFDKLTQAPESENKKNLLSDFVERLADERGSLKWHSLNADPLLQDSLAKISAALRKAAQIEGIDPTLKTFFEMRAKEFENKTDPFPFFQGDLAWIAIQGALDVTLGFYEKYDSPFKKTAFIEGYVGPVDKEKEELGRQFQSLIPGMEEGIAKSLGSKYTPHDFSKGLPPLKFAQLVGAGDPRVKYVPGGYNLPNVRSPGKEGITKKVFALNHQAARLEFVARPMGEMVIDPSQRTVTKEDVSNFVAIHENAHGVGPTDAKNLGSLNGPLEEAKADQEGIASLPTAVRNKIRTEKEAQGAAMAMLYSLLRGLSYGMSDDHGIGSFIEFTSLYREGGIVETPKGFYKVNFENEAIFKAAAKVALKIEQLQLKSKTDAAGAQKEAGDWLGDCKKNLPEKMKKEYLPKLEKMPKDVYPWYSFKFSDSVAAEMSK